jgi:hypothetical protein
MSKDKVQEIVKGSTPPSICYGSSMVMTINSLQKLIVVDIGYTCEDFWKTLISTLTNLSLS